MREPAAAIGSDELAEGLMLVRASTLKMIRFQLAMERQDRRVALQAVDDLVALDRRLDDYLADVPAAHEQLLFRNALDHERALLNQEKLGLVGEVIRRPAEPAVEEPSASEGAWLGPRDLPDDVEEPRRGSFWIAGFLVAASIVAAAAYLVGWPGSQEWLAVALRQFG